MNKVKEYLKKTEQLPHFYEVLLVLGISVANTIFVTLLMEHSFFNVSTFFGALLGTTCAYLHYTNKKESSDGV